MCVCGVCGVCLLGCAALVCVCVCCVLVRAWVRACVRARVCVCVCARFTRVYEGLAVTAPLLSIVFYIRVHCLQQKARGNFSLS